MFAGMTAILWLRRDLRIHDHAAARQQALAHYSVGR
jgi:deoxyribodipyrimidine photolyase